MKYLEEVPPDTIGCLSILQGCPDQTFFVNNCDILINADYTEIYKYHKKKRNITTIVSSVKNVRISYGVLKTGAEEQLVYMTEKPRFDYLVNTGMYVMEPRVLADIPRGIPMDITALIAKYLENGQRIGVFPIGENAWMDMGQLKEMEEMIRRIEKIQTEDWSIR